MLQVSPVGIIKMTVSNQGLTVACRGEYLAATHSRRTHIDLWRLTEQFDDTELKENENSNDLQWPLFPPSLQTLCGHDEPIKALAFNKDNELLRSGMDNKRKNNNQLQREKDSILLCSVDDYNFVVWDLLQSFSKKLSSAEHCVEIDTTATTNNNGLVLTSGRLLPSKEISCYIKNKETVTHCCFSWDECYIAVCRGRDIILILLESHQHNKQDPIAILKGHNSCVNSAEFSPHRSTWLVSVADDYTFIVWDVAEKSGWNILQRSYIPNSTAVPLVVAMDFVGEYASIATADGHLILIALSCAISPSAVKKEYITSAQHATFPVVRSLDSSKLLQNSNTVSACDSSPNTVDSGCIILSVSYFYTKQFRTQQGEMSPEDANFISQKSFFENLNQSLLLVVSTNNCIFCFNAFTFECVGSIDLVLYQNNLLLGDFKTLSLMSMSQELKNLEIICVTSNYSDNAIHISKLSLPKQTSFFHSRQEYRLVCPNTKLAENSILKLVPTPKGTNKTDTKTTNEAKDKRYSQRIRDKPLTFKNHIKSSGYSTAPTNRTLFKPNTNTKATKNCSKGCQARYSPIPHYDPTKVIHYKCQQQLSDNLTTTITNITFSSDGQNLAAALTDGTAMTVKRSPINKSLIFLGHKNSVNSVNLSHNGQWLLTASNDKTACIWKADRTNLLMTFEKISRNFDSKHFSVKKKNECFEKEITTAQFYYMDNFVLLASGRSFYIYNYNIDRVKDDIKSYLTKNQYKLIQHFQIDGNVVTDLTAINCFYSYIVLCCTSDRSLCVYDMNVGQRVLTIEATHPTAPHSIVMNAGSACLSLPASGYDLVMTAATTNGIKLWDLRSAQCVRQLDYHQNRSHRCRPTFSPCGKYVLAASENNTAYLYDIGKGVHCKQLSRHSDVVTGVVYHPLVPQVVTVTLDGKLYTFSDAEIK